MVQKRFGCSRPVTILGVKRPSVNTIGARVTGAMQPIEGDGGLTETRKSSDRHHAGPAVVPRAVQCTKSGLASKEDRTYRWKP
jgi:hypothetical protein